MTNDFDREYDAVLRAIAATEHHWQQEMPKRRVSIELATERKKHVTGHVGLVPRYYGEDDYWVDVSVDGFHTTHHGLQAAEDYLEGQFG